MGGPDIKTRFGRTDAESSSESVESQVVVAAKDTLDGRNPKQPPGM